MNDVVHSAWYSRKVLLWISFLIFFLPSCFFTQNTVRLRIGVDRPSNPNDVADYVLSRFNEDEEVVIERQTNQAISKLLSFIESRLNLDKNTLEKRLSNAS